MPNNSKRNQKKASKPKKVASQTNKLGQPSPAPQAPKLKRIGRAKHVQAACSILDPFCIHARGARRPDGLAQGTLPFQVRGFIPVSTVGTTGCALIRIVPGLGFYGYGIAAKADSTAPFIVPATWGTLPGSAFLTANAGAVRMLSMGAKFTATASMTNCQGLVHLAVTTRAVLGESITMMQENNVESQIRPLTSGFEMTWLSKPLGVDAHAFSHLGLTNTMEVFDWTSCYFEINGGPPTAQQVGVIEIVANVELQLNAAGVTTTGLAGGLSGLAMGSQPVNKIALSAQNAVHTAVPSIINGGVQMVENVIGKAASTAVDDIMSFMGEGLAMLGI